jgi:hypothetical protein
MDRSDITAPSPYVMVVERGDEERYQLLRKMFQSQRVDVVMDRRTGDRRGPGARATVTADAARNGERRSGDRRAALPDTWVNLGFFVARRHVR